LIPSFASTSCTRKGRSSNPISLVLAKKTRHRRVFLWPENGRPTAQSHQAMSTTPRWTGEQGGESPRRHGVRGAEGATLRASAANIRPQLDEIAPPPSHGDLRGKTVRPRAPNRDGKSAQKKGAPVGAPLFARKRAKVRRTCACSRTSCGTCPRGHRYPGSSACR